MSGQPPIARPAFEPTAAVYAPLARPVSMPPLAAPIPQPHPMLLLGEGRLACLADLGLFLLPFAVLALVGFGLNRWAESAGLAETRPADASPEPTEITIVFVATLGIGLAALVVVWLILLLRRQPLAAVGLSVREFGWNLLLGPGVCVAALILFAMLNILIAASSPGLAERLRANNDKLVEMIPRLPIVVIGLSMICVGLYEEVVIRGFLMPRLRRMTGSWTLAVIASSGLFAAAHIGAQETIMVIPLFFMGITFAIVTAWRKSVIPAIIGHGLFNFVQVVALFYLVIPNQGGGAPSPWGPGS